MLFRQNFFLHVKNYLLFLGGELRLLGETLPPPEDRTLTDGSCLMESVPSDQRFQLVSLLPW